MNRFADIKALAARGRLDEAWALFAPFAEAEPQAADVASVAARLCLGRRDLGRALFWAQHLTRIASEHAHSWWILGRTQSLAGQGTDALVSLREATLCTDADSACHTSLGVALAATGELDAAVQAYERALELDPSNFAARHNLANARERQGRSEGVVRGPGAMESRLAGLAAQARALYDEGRYAECQALVPLGLALSPYHVDLLEVAIGSAMQLDRFDEALPLVRRLASLRSGHQGVLQLLLEAHSNAVRQGRPEAARTLAPLLVAAGPGPGCVRLLENSSALALPPILPGADAIDELRGRYEAAIDALIAARPRLPLDTRLAYVPSFFLAYHGRNDRDIVAKAGRLWGQAVPELSFRAAHCNADAVRRPGRIRIGLLSRFLYSHSIGKTTEGFLRALPRDEFEVFLIHVGVEREDERTREMVAAADHSVAIEGSAVGPGHFAAIAALELDILFYQDIGMEPISYLLAHARLAPVQCVSFGHPDTTGVPAIDYFLSNDLYELPGAQDHYTEELFLLRALPTLSYYRRPAHRGQLRSRAELGLPEGGRLYVCPQTIFKLHPDFDPILQGILERDPQARIVLLRGADLAQYSALRARLERSLGPGLLERVLSLGKVPQDQFHDLLASSDVMLDTPHFNGMNSSLEAFAVGLPVVTLPTGLQRGRHTQAMYRCMGIEDAIASDADSYVEIAVALGNEPDRRERLRERILERNEVLFENRAVIGEFTRFFRWALERKGIART